MLSIKNNFLFIHYPKTGGNSVQYALSEHSEDTLILHPRKNDHFGVKSSLPALKVDSKHMRLARFKEHLDNDVYTRLFKFSIIRNPWDRVLSLYLFGNSGKAWRKVKQPKSELTVDRFQQTDESRPIKIFDKKNFFAFIHKFCSKKRLGNLRKFIRLPPADFSATGALDADIDYLMRYEHLEEDFAHVCKQIGIAPIVLPHLNKTKHEHYSHYYDADTAQLVADTFQEEIELGGYTFERRQDCGF